MRTDAAGLFFSDFHIYRELHGAARREPSAVMDQVSRHFESLFADLLLKGMRNTRLAPTMFDSRAMDTYRGLLDRQFGLEISRGPGLGLSPTIQRQLRQHLDLPAEARGPKKTAHELPVFRGVTQRPRSDAPPQQPSSAATPVWTDARSFVCSILPVARNAAGRIGVDPRALVAQAALETGWGRHVIRRSDGSSSYNLFGIKAGRSWQGQRVSAGTLEFQGGVMQHTRASFRSYDSLQAAFDDYVRLLMENPRYSEALRAGPDVGAFADALQAAGYATDPAYADKIRQIAGSQRLRAAMTV